MTGRSEVRDSRKGVGVSATEDSNEHQRGTTMAQVPWKVSKHALSWADHIESKSLEQIIDLSKMPFIFKHVAVMPDVHFGLGASVGTVIPTLGAIIPAAVGVDIGCGMIAARTSLTEKDMPDDRSDIRGAIEHQVPLSAGRYNSRVKGTAKTHVDLLEADAENSRRLAYYDKLDKRWRRQIGSLGSGNHFIELVLDERGRVWIFLHSGSRGIGNKIAQHHIEVAQAYVEQHNISLPNPDLAYLVEGTREFDDYITDLRWAQKFALLNRDEMASRIVKLLTHRFPDMEIEEEFDCHHNFTQREEHMGENIWVSRKGAIEAREGQLGLIPGSMGTRSYVVRGKGNPEAFRSAPHGAGRRLSRGAAKRTLTMDDFDRDMKGIEVRRSNAFLDELPAAYKDIDDVMRLAETLVEPVHQFRQIVNVKGV